MAKRVLREDRAAEGVVCTICQVFYEWESVPVVGGPVHCDKTIGCKSSNLVYGIWYLVYGGRDDWGMVAVVTGV